MKTKKSEYLEFHKNMCEKMIETTKKKNADYTGSGDDAFKNFTLTEIIGNCSTEQGFIVRMTDKLTRIVSYVQKGKLLVEDESVTDTLMDLANYCVLFAGYLEQKRKDGKL